MMGMSCREVATLHFSFRYQQDHLTASFNLNQLEPFTKTKLTQFFPFIGECTLEENTQLVHALLLIE